MPLEFLKEVAKEKLLETAFVCSRKVLNAIVNCKSPLPKQPVVEKQSAKGLPLKFLVTVRKVCLIF